MKRSTHEILTSHVGKLPAPPDLTEKMVNDPHGRPSDPEFATQLKQAVADVVRRQH